MSADLKEPFVLSATPSRSWVNRVFGPIKPTSLRNSVFGLTSIGLGASKSHSGGLTFPIILQQAGVLFGLVIILVSGLISMTTMNAVSKGVRKTGEKTYTGVIRVALGEGARKITAVLTFLLLIAVLCLYDVLSKL